MKNTSFVCFFGIAFSGIYACGAIVTVKISDVSSHPQEAQTRPLVVRCVTTVPQFFKDLPEAVRTARSRIQADSTAISMEPLQNGFLLHVDSFAFLRDVFARLWEIDVTASTVVKEFGLWDIEVLKNVNNEDLSLLIRSVYLLCEKLFSRKKTEACKSISD